MALHRNVDRGRRVVSEDGSRRRFRWVRMAANVELLQFEVIRAIAASLIGVAIALLWLVAINQR